MLPSCCYPFISRLTKSAAAAAAPGGGGIDPFRSPYLNSILLLPINNKPSSLILLPTTTIISSSTVYLSCWKSSQTGIGRIVDDDNKDDANTFTYSTIISNSDKFSFYSTTLLLQSLITDASKSILSSYNDDDDDASTIASSSSEYDDNDSILAESSYHSRPQPDPIKRWLCIVSSMVTLAGLWTSAIAFPALVFYTCIKSYWNTLGILLTLWATTMLIQFPQCDAIRDYLLRGCEYWFNGVDVIFQDKPMKDHTIFCYHPHGALAIGLTSSIRFLFHQLDHHSHNYPVIVASPFLRWFCPTWKILFDLCGIQFGGAGRKEFKQLLESGKSCVLITGGFHEATITCPGTDRIYLNNSRKGFVRYALREGYSLTPVYGFGETDTFSNVQGMWAFRFWLNSGTFQLPAVWGLGYWLCPILPKRERLKIVYGRPLHLPCIPNPSREEVDKYHAMYIERVRHLYDKYKPYDRHLEIW